MEKAAFIRQNSLNVSQNGTEQGFEQNKMIDIVQLSVNNTYIN